MNYAPAMRTRTPIRVLLTIALTLALLPMLCTFAPGGQVAGFTTASPAAADQMWYQSVGRASATAACEKSTTTELAAGWTNWVPSWDIWVNGSKGGFVCNRHITWAFDSIPPSSSGSGTTPSPGSGTTPGSGSCTTTSGGSVPTACALGTFGPGGGLVFLISGGRTYEMAPKSWNSVAGDPTRVWTTNAAKCYSTTVGAAGDQNCQTNNLYPETTAGAQAASTTAAVAIGMGAANTNAIIARMNDGIVTSPADYAAGLARGYSPVVSGVTINDWFLPSQDELNAMCNYSRNPATPPTGMCTGFQDGTFAAGAFGFADADYWPSSQGGATFAESQLFVNGSRYNDSKHVAVRVRPVRAF